MKPHLESSSVLTGVTFGSRSDGDAAALARKAERQLVVEAHTELPAPLLLLLHC